MESLLLETALHSSVGMCPASSSEGISVTNPFRHPYNQIVSSFLLFLSSHVGTDAFISNISLGSSQSWYFRIGQFELVFFGIIMLQICILRYLEIMPLNINNLFLGDPSGRRKKRSINSTNVCRRDDLAESMLQILKKLDDDECLPLVLCTLQSLSKRGEYYSNSNRRSLSQDDKIFSKEKFKVTDETKRLLDALNTSGNQRVSKEKKMEAEEEEERCNTSENMIYFKKAVRLGDASHQMNSTICHDTYHSCSLSEEEIVAYVSVIGNADML